MTNQQTDLVNLNIKYVDAIKNKMVVFFVIPNIRKLHVQCKNVEFVDRSYWIGYLYHGLHWKQKLIDFSCLPLKWIYIHFLSVSRTIQISLLVYLYIQIKENKCSKTNVKPLQALCLVINQNISPNNHSLFVNIEINIW